MGKKVSVIGIGRLGLTFALLCEVAGYEVMGCDKRQDYVEELTTKSFKTSEPKVNVLLQWSRNFTATTDISKTIQFSDLLFVFVPTPSKDDGAYDHQYIEEVISDLIKQENIAGKTLVISCTTMPMYCKDVQSRLDKYGVAVVYNPEFIAQGEIANGLEKADFVLIGNDNGKDLTNIFELYKSIMKIEPVFKVLSLTAAEITKIGINCFLTTKITFANMIGDIAIKSDEEDSVKDILQTIGSDSRIGNKYLNYGFGYGGVCLPRDNKALGVHAVKVGLSSTMNETIDLLNFTHLVFLKRQYLTVNPDKNFPFIFNQLSYKRGVNILTDSQQYALCKLLLDEGYKVIIAESAIVIELVKPELEKYGDLVSYGNGIGTHSIFEDRLIEGQKKQGFVIDL